MILDAVRIDTSRDFVVRTVSSADPLTTDGVPGQKTRFKAIDELSLTHDQLRSSLAAFETVASSEGDESVDQLLEVSLNTPVQFDILIKPFDNSKETRVVLDTGETGAPPAVRIVPAGQNRVSILHTYNTTGSLSPRVVATQGESDANLFDELISDNFLVAVSEAPPERANGELLSGEGVFGLDLFDLVYTQDDFLGTPEIQIGAIHGHVVESRLPVDATLQVQMQAAPGTAAGTQREVTANFALDETSVSRTGFFSFDLEQLFAERSTDERIRLLEGNIRFRIIGFDEREVDELFISSEEVKNFVNRGTAPLSNETPTTFDVDLLFDFDTIEPGNSLSGDVDILIDNAIEDLIRADDDEPFEITVDFGDGSEPNTIQIGGTLKRDGGDFPEGLFANPAVFLQHDLRLNQDLRTSLSDRLFNRSYADKGDFTMTVTATMPNGRVAQDSRLVPVRDRQRFEVASVQVASNMEVFSRNESGEIAVAKSVPRVTGSLRTQPGFELAVPTAEIEIRGQTQVLPIGDLGFELDFDSINLLEFVDINADASERQVTAQLTIRDENNPLFKDVSLHTFAVDVPSLAVESFTSTLEAHVTAGFDTDHIYKLDNFPIAIERNINPREVVIVENFFFNLRDFDSTKSLIDAALDHRFRNPETGQTGRPNGFQRTIGFDREFAGTIDVKVFQAERVVGNAESQTDFIAALGSLIDVKRVTAAALSRPTISVRRASFTPHTEVDEGEFFNNVLEGVQIFHPADDVVLSVSFGDKSSALGPPFSLDGTAGPLAHRFDDNPSETFDPQTNRSSTRMRLSLTRGGETISEVNIPFFIRNTPPTVVEAFTQSNFSPLTLPLHPLQSVGDRNFNILIGRDDDGTFPLEDIEFAREEFPNAVVLFARSASREENLAVEVVNGEDGFELNGFTLKRFQFDADAVRQLGRFNSSPQSTELPIKLPIRVQDDDGAVTEVVFDVRTVISPIGISVASNISSEDQLATRSREGDSSKIPLPTRNVFAVGETVEGLTFQLNGETRRAANTPSDDETFELTIDLGDGRKIELFRDTTDDSQRAFRVRANPFTDAKRVPYDTRLGQIRFVDFDDTRQALVSYSHAGSFRLTASTNITIDVDERDAYGELTLDVLPAFDVEVNADGSVSGEFGLGVLPDGVGFEGGSLAVKLSVKGNRNELASVTFTSLDVDAGTLKFSQQLGSHFRQPGAELEVQLALPALVTSNDKVVGESSELIHTLVPTPKANTEEILLSVTGNLIQNSPIDVAVTLPSETLAAANSATDSSPFELSLDFGNGNTAHLLRNGSTPDGQMFFISDSFVPGTTVRYDADTGEFTLASAQTNRSLVEYFDFGAFIIQVASECGFGSTTIVIQNVLPTVIDEAVFLFADTLELTADVVMPRGGRIRLDHGEQSAEVDVPASTAPQAVTLRISAPDKTITQASVTTTEDVAGAPTSTRTVDVQTIEKVVATVDGSFARDVGTAGSLTLDLEPVVALLAEKLQRAPDTAAANVSFTLSAGVGEETLTVEVTLDNNQAITARLQRSNNTETFQIDEAAPVLEFPVSFNNVTTTKVSIADLDGCIEGEIEIDLLGDPIRDFEELIAIRQRGTTTLLGSRTDSSTEAAVRIQAPGNFERTVVVPAGRRNFVAENIPAQLGDTLRVSINDGATTDVIVTAGNRSPCDEHPMFRVATYTGNVSAQFANGTLTVQGDEANNGVAIFSDARGVVVQGIAGTLVNGALEAFVISIPTSLDVLQISSLGAGDDLVCITDVDISQDNRITSTPGEDVVLMSRVHIKRDSTINLGDDDDLLAMTSVTIDGTSLIDAGDGNDTVIAADTVDTVRGGDGKDLIDGGAGADVLLGEGGDDTLVPSATDDSLDGGVDQNVVLLRDRFEAKLTGAGASSFSDPVSIAPETDLAVSVQPGFVAEGTEVALFAAPSIAGSFADTPLPGSHLGFGYFAGEFEAGRSVRVEATRAVLSIFQAGAGDATGDGKFDSTDLVAVFASGTYETDNAADWTSGDWNHDGRFDTADLIAAFQTGTYALG